MTTPGQPNPSDVRRRQIRMVKERREALTSQRANAEAEYQRLQQTADAAKLRLQALDEDLSALSALMTGLGG